MRGEDICPTGAAHKVSQPGSAGAGPESCSTSQPRLAGYSKCAPDELLLAGTEWYARGVAFWWYHGAVWVDTFLAADTVYLRGGRTAVGSEDGSAAMRRASVAAPARCWDGGEGSTLPGRMGLLLGT
jgi:hypothetical protein